MSCSAIWQDGGPNKMAVQKLHEFCEAQKRKIFALRKIIVQGKTLKKI
jgi:hypothetical protein